MGTKRLVYSLLLSVFFFSIGCVASVSVPNEQVLDARNQLKDYALVTCLIAIDPKSTLAEDLKYSKRAFSFMGNGGHMLVQNEETFDTEHDPYAKAASVLIDEAAHLLGYMKNGETSKSYGCFRAYQSKKFNDFIVSQDSYVTEK
ncbi:hypothetical protein [Vibrio mimicus]|uniref:hypothetical protein n=1 Tax=Vibrio mimicus TaxID=674 RepID=UPI001FEE1E67|nr:hypothetical protein [Vibrio mimicus]